MPRQREPKTVEEVLAFVEGILPSGWSVMVYVTFYASVNGGHRSSSREYSIHFWPKGHPDNGFDVKATSPADVVKLAVKRIAARQAPSELVASGPRRIAPRRPARELTTREFLHLDPPRQIPFPHPKPLSRNGERGAEPGETHGWSA